MLTLTLFGFMNINISQNFNWNFRNVLIRSNYLIFWQQTSNSSLAVESDIIGTNFFLQIVPTLVIYTTSYVKDMYVQISPISGLLSLWLASLDFQQNISSQYVDRVEIQGILNHYKAICKLSKIFSHCYEMILLSVIVEGVLYYSCSFGLIGDYIFTIKKLGFQFYMLEYLLIFSTLWAFATTFTNRVNDIYSISNNT